VLAVPVHAGDERVGVITAYAAQPRAFDPLLVEDLALAGAGVLSVALREAEHDRLAEQLREAVTSREVIDQAKGIVMGQRRCTADQAFEVLVRISQQRNIRVRAVAEHLVLSVSAHAPAGGRR
jgi:AmiR/NasT family two-component response regulator